MIEWIIRRSVANRFLVMMGALFLSIWGTWTIINTPVDALPDLSDVQVIIKTSYPGQAPQIVENQVTYPLTTTMLSVPGAKTVRGFSQFGDSYVYVIFEERHRSVLGPFPRAGISESGSGKTACRCEF